MANQDTILVADDDVSVLTVIAWVLREACPACNIRTASTGQGCLDLIALEPPDILVLDVHLPDINGNEICQRLKADAATGSSPSAWRISIQTST